jgi:hypothetical protein
VNDSIHVKMSIVQEITKPLKYNYKHWITFFQYILICARCNLWAPILTYWKWMVQLMYTCW